MWRVAFIVLSLLGITMGFQAPRAATLLGAHAGSAVNITRKHFQVDFLNDINTQVATDVERYLNDYLASLLEDPKYAQFHKELEATQRSHVIEEKMLCIKQILDTEGVDHSHFQSFYALRNINFLKRLKDKLSGLQNEAELEMRQLRWYELCKQFKDVTSGKVAPAFVPAAGSATTNRTITLNVLDFGGQLYERVKISGAEIIDDYLNTLRKLLREVIDEMDNDEHTVQSSKILSEIDAIIATSDFYAKRQRLYDYLQGNLAADYAQFQSTEAARDDLASILAALRTKSWDLLLNFIFSNFEFLEHLHEEWQRLLPATATRDQYDADSQILYDVHYLYQDFKHNHESDAKYEAYMDLLRQLLHRVEKDTGNKVHIYEMLHNASQNLGAATLNMMRQKCEDI